MDLTFVVPTVYVLVFMSLIILISVPPHRKKPLFTYFPQYNYKTDAKNFH